MSNKLIDSASMLARGFGISPAVIGLTLLAYGTSLPELSVSSIASIKDHDGISVSNVIGSNIYNIAVVMGIVSLLAPIVVKERKVINRSAVVMAVAASLLIFLSFIGGIGRITGIAMVVPLILYTGYVIRHDRLYVGGEKDDTISKGREAAVSIFLLAGVLISGNFTVSSAVDLARLIGIREWIIGATIVAAGTSLPETVVSIVAARKGEMGMSIGNIVGSNIFNILWILGFASILNPLAIDPGAVYTDLIFLCVITMLFSIGLAKGRLSRKEGGLYIAIYLGYIGYLLYQAQ